MAHQHADKGPLDRLLYAAERGGDALPNSAKLFALMASSRLRAAHPSVRADLQV